MKSWNTSGEDLSRQEGRRILSLDAKPETGIVDEIGTGFVCFRADQGNGYVVGTRQTISFTIALPQDAADQRFADLLRRMNLEP
jgi:hypothetical protein